MASNLAEEPQRGVNWFEGGRRISKLLMAVVVGIGAVIVIGVDAETPTFFIAGPGQPWRFETKACKSPNYSRYPSDLSVGSESFVLCFEALSNGKIPYAVAPEPENAARARKEQEARDAAEDAADEKAREARGEPQPPPLIRVVETPRWYYGGDPYDEPAATYIDGQVRAFQLTPQRQEQVRNSATRRQWAARVEAFTDGAPWVIGIVAAVWVLTAVIGWIVRGFAGVPMGSDFRPRRG
jgi:hypothetical protein